MSDKRQWGDMFSARPAATDTAPPAEAREDAQDAFELVPGLDPAEYRAFLTQRGRRGPSLFIDFRSVDPRTGALRGTMLSYPLLSAIDYVDDHTILLDFGMRHVRIEGERLGELIARLHAGSITVVQAYAAKVWGNAEPVSGAIVRSITHLGLGQGH